MINLVVEDYCQDCEHFDPHSNSFSRYSAKEHKMKVTTIVTCTRRGTCSDLYQFIKSQAEEKEKEGKTDAHD